MRAYHLSTFLILFVFLAAVLFVFSFFIQMLHLSYSIDRLNDAGISSQVVQSEPIMGEWKTTVIYAN